MYVSKYLNTASATRYALKSGLVCLMSVLAATVHADTTIVFADNEAPSDPFPTAFPNASSWFIDVPNALSSEFRVVNISGSSGTVSGGGQKSIVGASDLLGGPAPTPPGWQFVTWTFDNSNQLSAVANTDTTLGANIPSKGPDGLGKTGDEFISAAPGGDVGLFKNALFLNAPFGFLAPTVGSAAANVYGVAIYTPGGGNTFTIRIPTAEAQWANGAFPLGFANAQGITFSGTTAADNHTFRLTGEHQITNSEDSLGFAQQVTQWDLVGVINSDPAANITDYSTLPAAALVIPVASLVTDSEGDGVTVQTTGARTVTGTAGGSASCTATDCTYNPAGAVGNDSFTVIVADDFSVQGSVNVVVNVTVTAAPLAGDDAVTIDQDTASNSINLAANDTDSDNAVDLASIVVINPPSNGSLGALPGDGTVPYTPNPGFTGTDTFTYTIDDVTANTSNIATVTITVNCSDTCGAVGVSSITPGTLAGSLRVTIAEMLAAGIPPDDAVDGVGTSCDPDCFDFVATTSAGQAVVAFALSGPIQASSVYRKVINGQWVGFDTSAGDSAKSAPGSLGSCPPPDDPAYVIGLNSGSFCLQLTIVDGGPNDGDVVPGQVTDPGGIGVGQPTGAAAPPQKLEGGGCTLSNSIQPQQRADWWLVALVLMLLGGRYLRRNPNRR